MGEPAAFSIANYRPPGPVARAFIHSAKIAPFLMGPVGSGKTTAAIFSNLRYTALMPVCSDGVIRAKGVIVRSDYRTLWRTTLPSWWQWFPRDYPGSTFTGGPDRPSTHELPFTTPRGRRIELTVEFAALGSHRIEDVLRGWEGSWAHMEEADLMEESALDFLIQRSSRFPPVRLLNGVDLKPRVAGSFNPPGSPRHWIVNRFIKRQAAEDGVLKASDLELFVQPSGLSPDAENITNLSGGRKYYERIAANSPVWDVQRFVHGKVGYDRSGAPVYPEFDPRFNVAPAPLKAIPGRPIYLGLDCSGLHPGAVVVQRAANLQFRVLREIYLGRIGPTGFIDHLVAVLQGEFRDCAVERAFYDPSNDYGADKEGGERSYIDMVGQALRVPMTPAPTNEIPLRVEAVRNLLVWPIDSLTRGLVIDPERCLMLHEGFMADYRYKLNSDGALQNPDMPRPEKNDHANVHDALQYVCLGLQGRAGSIASAAKGMRPGALAAAGGNTVVKADFAI